MSKRASKGSGPQVPADFPAERAVLGSILLDPAVFAAVTGILVPDDFSDDLHLHIFAAMKRVAGAGKPLDVLLLANDLRATHVGFDAVYLAELAQAVPTAGHAEHYARLVREKADKRRLQSIGTALSEGCSNGQPTSDLLAETLDRLDAYQGLHGSVSVLFPALGGDAVVDTAVEHRYLVPGVLAEGQHCTLSGSFKTLKTSVGIDLAISLTTGGMFLGYFKVPEPVRVGFFSGECAQSTVAETVKRICWAAGTDYKTLTDLIFCMQVPNLSDPEHIRALRQFIINHRLKVLIIDPLYLALGSVGDSASNMFSMGDLLKPLGAMADELGCTLIVVHHTSVGATRLRGSDPATLADVAYSGLPQWVRQWILLSRRSEYVPGTGRHDLWLSVGGSAGHSGLWSLQIDEGEYQPDTARIWSTMVSGAQEAQERTKDVVAQKKQEAFDAKAVQDMAEVLAAIKRLKDCRGTMRDIRDQCPLGVETVRRAVFALLDSGQLATCEIKKPDRKTPREGYRLVNDDTV